MWSRRAAWESITTRRPLRLSGAGGVRCGGGPAGAGIGPAGLGGGRLLLGQRSGGSARAFNAADCSTDEEAVL